MTLDVAPRVERKYTFPTGAAPAILAWLEHACVPDPLHPSSVVSSVYFDTPGLDALHQKLDGDFFKCKLRLRWYEPIGGDAPEGDMECFLEAKLREGAMSRKLRLTVTLPGRLLAARQLDSAEIEELPLRYPGLTGEVRALAPVVLVRYERRRFVEPLGGVRVSLDTDIQCAAASRSRLVAFAPAALDVGVLETKSRRLDGLGALAPLRGLLTATSASFSKYARCLRLAIGPGERGGEG